jgi:hypothetical protein
MVLHLICESVAAGVVFPEKSQGVAGTGRDGGSAVQLGTSPRPPNYAKGACEQGLQPTFTVQTLPQNPHASSTTGNAYAMTRGGQVWRMPEKLKR